MTKLLFPLFLIVLTGCVSAPTPATDCVAKLSQAMKDIEEFSAAADRTVLRDDEGKSYIRIEPNPGFRENMLKATGQWEQAKDDCWPANLKKNAPAMPFSRGHH